MKWGYEEYLNQPNWFINELIYQLNDENNKHERELRKMNNG